MDTECAPGFEHRIRDSWQAGVILRNQVEPEYILAWLNIDSMSQQNELVRGIKSFATKNIYKPQIETQLL